MNGKQTAAVLGAGALGVGAVGGYFVWHKEASATKTVKEQLINPQEGFSAMAAAQLLALYQQVPIYPQASFGIHYPVTRFAVADAAWRTWIERAQSDSALYHHLVGTLQIVSDEIADRLKVPNVDWLILLTFNDWTTVFSLASFENLFGEAARKTSTLDYFTELEAQQFWVEITNLALGLDFNRVYDVNTWNTMVTAASAVASEFNAIPDQYGLAAQWLVEWGTRVVAQVAAGAAAGLMAGLFSTILLPVLGVAVAGGGGYYLYRKFK